MLEQMLTRCETCGTPLPGRRRRWCSYNCKWRATEAGKRWVEQHPEAAVPSPRISLPAQRKLSREMRAFIIERDGGICGYCGDPGDTVDHVIPFSRGGSSTPDNLLCACWPCNSVVRSRQFDSFEEKRDWLLFYWSPAGDEIRTSPKCALVKPGVIR